MAGESSGSTPTTRLPWAATAIPEMSPPPPTGTISVVVSGRSSTTSSPTVPWPAIVSGWSNGWTSVRPVSASRSARRAKASVGSRDSRSTAAP